MGMSKAEKQKMSAEYEYNLALQQQAQDYEQSEYDRRFDVEYNAQQETEQRQNEEWSRRLAAQTDAQLAVMQAESQEYDRRMNAYESPAAKAKLLKEAGFNPLAAAGMASGSVGEIGAASPSVGDVSTSSAPSPFPSSGVNSVHGGSSSTPDWINSIGGVIKDVADAASKGADLPYLMQTLSGRINAVFLDNESKKLLNHFQDAQNFILGATKDKKILSAFLDVEEQYANIALKASQQGFYDAAALENIWSAFEKEVSGKLKKEELVQLKLRQPYVIAEMKANIQYLNNASQNQIAQAGYNAANTEVAKATKAQIDNYNYIHGNPDVQRSIMEQFSNDALQSALRNELTEKQISQLRYAVSQAAYADSMKEFTYWSGQVQGIVGTVGDVASKFFGAGLLGKVLGNGGSVPVAPPSATGPQVFRPFWQTNTQ